MRILIAEDDRQWESLLRQKFNEERGRRRRVRIPGFYRPIEITFLHTSKIAGQLFDMRNK